MYYYFWVLCILNNIVEIIILLYFYLYNSYYFLITDLYNYLECLSSSDSVDLNLKLFKTIIFSISVLLVVSIVCDYLDVTSLLKWNVSSKWFDYLQLLSLIVAGILFKKRVILAAILHFIFLQNEESIIISKENIFEKKKEEEEELSNVEDDDYNDCLIELDDEIVDLITEYGGDVWS